MSAQEFAGTMPVTPQQRFDLGALEPFLAGRIPGLQRPLTVQQFRGGQSNPTFLLSAADGAQFVLRKQPSGPLLPSAHAVDREFRVIGALHAAGFPVARPVCLGDDPGVLGTLFYVMQYVEGRNFWDPTLPGLTPPERAALYAEMNRVLVALHALDFAAIGLEDFGRPGNYFARQIARWSRQYRASETEPIEAMEQLLEWLPKHIPASDETTLVHGDYRLDNLIFHPSEPRILAVVDWELSTLGHPLADFAYHAMVWRVPGGENRGLGGVDVTALGIPSESQYLEEYCRRTGRAGVAPDVWEFCMAYNLFRIACIRQGILRRVLDGTAASRHAREAGARARETAELAWAQVQAHFAP
jgi:aminoglycoside phosphotransferase (APT) family kinase protein